MKSNSVNNNIFLCFTQLFIEPSNFEHILGFRSDLNITLLKPGIAITRLRMILNCLKLALERKFRFVFICKDIKHPLLKKLFIYTVKHTSHYFFTNVLEFKSNMNKLKKKNTITIGLFLNAEENFELKKEANREGLPIILFQTVTSQNDNMNGYSVTVSNESLKAEQAVFCYILLILKKHNDKKRSLFKKKS